MSLEKEYKQLTSVDIREQKAIWDERGKGYYGEYLLFCKIYKEIKGNFKILMNLRLPVNSYSQTEIDLLLIHETGLYVFEIKHYSGTIYGKDTDTYWTQYFRTAKNNSFKNPISQNGHHVRVLKSFCPEVPVHSFVVFTNIECNIKVTNNNPYIDVCSLGNVIKTLTQHFSSKENTLSLEKIDNIFCELSKYSNMHKKVSLNGQVADFSAWLEPIIQKLEKTNEETNKEKEVLLKEAKKLKWTKICCLISSITIIVLSIILSINSINKNTVKLKEFEQNFLHINQIENQYIEETNTLINVSNVSLKEEKNKSVSFTARLSVDNNIYGFYLTKNSKYLVTTKSGKVFEYDVFGDHLLYNRDVNTLFKSSGNLAKIKFYNIYKSADIAYIKITGITMFNSTTADIVAENLELELYSIN